MSADTGRTTRERTRTAIALLTVVGFVLIAAVLPVVGGDAPGQSLVPQRMSGQAGAGSQAGSLQRALQGQAAGASRGGQGTTGGSKSLVKGLLSKLDEGSGSQQLSGDRQGGKRGSGQQGQTSDGESPFGALNPGSKTGVGASKGLTSQSLRSQSSTPHFIVQSSEPGYWRTGAYDTYTGTDWTAEDLPVRADWPRRATPASADRRTVTQTYRLLKPATALPSVWKPTDVQSGFADRLQVTQQGAIKAMSRKPANTTYTVVSKVPPDNPSRLRQAGTDYPDRLEATYTQLPADTPQRLAARTNEITRNAKTPYAKAAAIESWLESHKDYSLNASYGGDHVADHFVFDMQTGYCEYFATAMTVMLRTQDVPARYVVGYSTGQPQGNGTYLVRAMNAHAWVEVYFPDTGWVKFDPTPGRSRLTSEFQAYKRAAENGNADGAARRFLDDAAAGSVAGRQEGGSPGGSTGRQSSNGDTSNGNTPGTNSSTGTNTTTTINASDVARAYNHTEQGSPGESFDTSSGPAYSISLRGDPVPGQPVTVRVTRDGDPAADVAVAFNGKRVGRTNASGLVRAPVPFRSQLDVTISATATGQSTGSASLLGPGGGATIPGRWTPVSRAGGASQPTNRTNTTRSFDVPTDLDIAIRGDPAPGETVTVATTIRNRTVAGANVSLNGSQVGRTNADGTLDVSLPSRERVTVAASRGEASGNRTVRLANVSVTTSGFALPGLSITVSVTDEGHPVEGATVAVGGETTTTGPDGTATVSLPLATRATATVETPGGITESTAINYQFLTAGLVVVLALVALAVLVVLWRQAAASGISIREQLVASLYWLSGAFVTALVGLAIYGERLLSQFPVVARRIVRGLRTAWHAFVAAVRAQDFSGLPGPRDIWAWLVAAIRGFLSSARSSAPIPGVSEDDVATAASVAADPEGATPDAKAQVRRAWREFRDRLSVADYRTKTPGELAQIGIEQGFPSGAVATLCDAVQAIEYGRRDPRSYVDDVTAAEQELASGDDGSDDAPADAPHSGTPHATDGGASE